MSTLEISTIKCLQIDYTVYLYTFYYVFASTCILAICNNYSGVKIVLFMEFDQK